MKGNVRFFAAEAGKLLLLALLTGYLFYDSVLAGLFLLVFSPLLVKRDLRKHKEKERLLLRGEFQDVIALLSGNLNAGYSLEQAVFRGTEEYGRLCAKKGLLYRELSAVCYGIKMNGRVEELFLDFAKRSGVEEIRDFAELLAMAKVHGGDMQSLIAKTAMHISEKHNMELSLQTAQAAKKLESRIMLAVPLFMVAYMRLTNGDYVTPLYGTVAGRIVMSVALVVIIASAAWMERITKLEEL